MIASSRVSGYRKALTLIELLIVMAILSLLAGIALPNIKTMIKQQRLSRSASAIQSYIDAARSKAIGTGQSYGVVIERSGFDSAIARSQSIRLRFAYAPPDYSGDVPEALAVVLPSGNLAFSPMHAPTLVAAAQQRQAQRNGAVVDPIVRPLDLISIGSVGLTASINEIRFATASDFGITAQNPAEFVVPGFVPDSSGNNTSDWPRSPAPSDAQISGWPVIEIRTPSAIDFDPADQVRRVLLPGTAISFRVTRRPRPSILTPMDLVEGTVVDLNYSGIGIGNFTFAPSGIELTTSGIGARAFHEGPYTTANPAPDYGSITIMFDSQGAVSNVYFPSSGTGEVTVSDPLPTVKVPPIRQDARSNIFLLVGRSGNVRSGDPVNGITGPSGPLGFDRAGIANLLDLEAVWVVINRQTGEIFTTNVDALPRNADDSLNVPGTTPAAVLSNAITISQVSAANFYEGGR